MAISAAPAAELKDWFQGNAEGIFNRARTKADGQQGDPRPQGAPAYPLGRHQAQSCYGELDTWFDAYASTADGKVYMKDLNTSLWYSDVLPQN
jgi:hypothetical protein